MHGYCELKAMCVCALTLTLAIRTGTVRLHLTDAHNRPIPNHEVWLDTTSSTKPVRPFGVQWFIPSGPYHGSTDKNGDAAIPGVPLRKPMMVVTRFGPRFDSYVTKNGNASGASLDVIKFEGAVYAGQKARVVLADDYEVSGTVTDAAGKPLPGIAVYLGDTGFGHMGGYPGTTLDGQVTDTHGAYRFTKLPNCAFLVVVDAAPHMGVESRVGNGPWRFLAIIGQLETSESVLTDKPKTTCDFRVSRTAHLTVSFKGTPSELKGWTAWAYRGKDSTTGQDLGYDSSSSKVDWDVLPGNITIWVSIERGERWYVANKLTVQPGDVRTVEISMSEVLKRKARK